MYIYSKSAQQTENITMQQNINDDVGPVLLMCQSFSKDSQLSISNNNNVNKQDRETPSSGSIFYAHQLPPAVPKLVDNTSNVSDASNVSDVSNASINTIGTETWTIASIATRQQT